MARLSSQPSQGSAANPRKRGRKAKHSIDKTSSKRSASPSSSKNSPITKRPKRAVADDHEQLLEEDLRSSVVVEQEQENIEVQVVVEQPVPSRRRGHSEPPVISNDEDDAPASSSPALPSTQPPSGLTPHLQKLGANHVRPMKSTRHARMSMPAHLEGGVQQSDQEVQFIPLAQALSGRTARRLRRSHLSEEVNSIEEHQKQDQKDKKELLELRRQISAKNERIKELELDLETARLSNIEPTAINSIQNELHQAHQEVAQMKASSIYADSSVDQDEDFGATLPDLSDADDVPLINPDDINVSQEEMMAEPHSQGYYARMASRGTFYSQESAVQASLDDTQGVGSTQVSFPDKIADKAVQRFETEITRLNAELAESHATLQILNVGIQNLYAGDTDASANDSIWELRHAFEDAREELETIMSGSTLDLNNVALIRKLVDHVKGLMSELREKIVITEEHNKQETILRSQVKGLLDTLSDANIRIEDLEKKHSILDQTNDQQQRSILELEDELTAMNENADTQDKVIRDKEIAILALEGERNDQATQIDRLKHSIEGYREDLARVTTTMTQLEQDYKDRISSMEEEHATAVQQLRSHLDDEMEGRANAEEDAQQKADYIDELEGRIDLADTAAEELRTQIDRLLENLQTEKANRESVEADREEKDIVIADLNEQYERASNDIDQLRQEIETLRDNLESERDQREATEQELDQRNEEISQLQNKLHDSGIQANELRTKLYQVQMEKEASIQKLKEEASAREAEHEEALDIETRAREDAEREIANLENKLSELETDLANNEASLAETTQDRDRLVAERDQQISHLTSELAELEDKYKSLVSSSRMQITTLEAAIQDMTNTINERNVTIASLENDAVLVADQHASDIAARDAEIDEVTTDLLAERNKTEQLERQVDSLERRVENEAHDLLEIVNNHADETEALNKAIATHEKTIASLEANAEQRAADFEAEISEKTLQIEELQTVTESRASDIEALHDTIDNLKQRFREAEADTRITIDALQAAHRELLKQNEQMSLDLKKRNAEALQAVEDMQVRGLQVRTNGVSMHKVSEGRVTKANDKMKIMKKTDKRKNKRNYDSGFGIDEDNGDATLVEDELWAV